eukprot:SAG31_NODE_2595_length_5421_cov_2.387636_6_plen_204_part_00
MGRWTGPTSIHTSWFSRRATESLWRSATLSGGEVTSSLGQQVSALETHIPAATEEQARFSLILPTPRYDADPLWFPASYVQLTEAGPVVATRSDHSGERCIVIHSYAKAEEGELGIQAGDVVEVLHKQEGWWTGRGRGGEEGMFPANYVLEFLAEPLEYMGVQKYNDLEFDMDNDGVRKKPTRHARCKSLSLAAAKPRVPIWR